MTASPTRNSSWSSPADRGQYPHQVGLRTSVGPAHAASNHDRARATSVGAFTRRPRRVGGDHDRRTQRASRRPTHDVIRHVQHHRDNVPDSTRSAATAPGRAAPGRATHAGGELGDHQVCGHRAGSSRAGSSCARRWRVWRPPGPRPPRRVELRAPVPSAFEVAAAPVRFALGEPQVRDQRPPRAWRAASPGPRAGYLLVQ
jgi:hypothetical protein